MAMKKCRDCGKEIGASADKCIHCGAQQTTRLAKGCLWILVIGIGTSVLIGQMTDNEAEPAAPAVPVAVAPDSIIGMCAHNPSDDRNLGEILRVEGDQAYFRATDGGAGQATYPKYLRVKPCR